MIYLVILHSSIHDCRILSIQLKHSQQILDSMFEESHKQGRLLDVRSVTWDSSCNMAFNWQHLSAFY